MAELFLSKGSMEIIIDALHIVLSAPAFAVQDDLHGVVMTFTKISESL